MNFEETDHVRIKTKNITGEIIDLTHDDEGTVYYLVESDKEGPVDDPDAYPGRWPIYTCAADELEKI